VNKAAGKEVRLMDQVELTPDQEILVSLHADLCALRTCSDQIQQMIESWIEKLQMVLSEQHIRIKS
jgi:hypothetical protein